MSCASPIPHFSPTALHMYRASLVSPCRSPLDDADPLHLHGPFSFSLTAAPHAPHLLSSLSLSSSPFPSRPVLTDIHPGRHKNSPQSPLKVNKSSTPTNLPRLGSPRKIYKENLENAGKIQTNDIENERPIDGLYTLPCKTKSAGKWQRSDVENGPLVDATSPSPPKKKRPSKLAIPELARLASLGKAKEFALSEQETEIHSCETPLFAVSCKKGSRDCMEDAYTAIANFQGKPNQAFLGVFDGHGGKSAAQFAAENLGRHIDMAIQSQKGENESLEDAMHAGYLAADSEFSAKGINSGACSICAFVKEGQVVIANAGDCKAVLCRDGKAEALSKLHRASDIEERQRIESLGGYVDCFNGIWRVQGTLAVTRAFGDIHLKQWVSADPEVRQLDITYGCEFLILASDGLWDKVSDQEAVDCARKWLHNEVEKDIILDSPGLRPSKAPRHHQCSIPNSTNSENSGKVFPGKIDACDKLIHKACSRGNLDDITVMIVLLKGFAMPRETLSRCQ